MSCVFCGAENPNAASPCPSCGRVLASAGNTPQPLPAEASLSPTPPKPPFWKRNFFYLILGAALTLVLSGVFSMVPLLLIGLISLGNPQFGEAAVVYLLFFSGIGTLVGAFFSLLLTSWLTKRILSKREDPPPSHLQLKVGALYLLPLVMISLLPQVTSSLNNSRSQGSHALETSGDTLLSQNLHAIDTAVAVENNLALFQATPSSDSNDAGSLYLATVNLKQGTYELNKVSSKNSYGFYLVDGKAYYSIEQDHSGIQDYFAYSPLNKTSQKFTQGEYLYYGSYQGQLVAGKQHSTTAEGLTTSTIQAYLVDPATGTESRLLTIPDDTQVFSNQSNLFYATGQFIKKYDPASNKTDVIATGTPDTGQKALTPSNTYQIAAVSDRYLAYYDQATLFIWSLQDSRPVLSKPVLNIIRTDQRKMSLNGDAFYFMEVNPQSISGHAKRILRLNIPSGEEEVVVQSNDGVIAQWGMGDGFLVYLKKTDDYESSNGQLYLHPLKG